MAIRGIFIECPNEYSNYLYRIFHGIDITKYHWQVLADFVITPGNKHDLKTKFFDNTPTIVNGEELLNAFSSNEYCAIELDIRAFNNIDEIKGMGTYQDFIDSNCQLALFLYDTCWYDIYCKGEEVIGIIYNNCLEIEGAKPEIITEKNDSRTRIGVC